MLIFKTTLSTKLFLSKSILFEKRFLNLLMTIINQIIENVKNLILNLSFHSMNFHQLKMTKFVSF